MKALAVTSLILVALTGCSDPAATAPESATGPAAKIAPVVDNKPAAPPLPQVAHSKAIDFAIGDKERQMAMPLFGDQSVDATVVSSAAGELAGVGILVGNYGGKSTGAIEMEVCVATECRNASIDTASSVDNEILAFPVDPALSIASGTEVKLKLTRQTGGNEFAIWTFPVADGATKLESTDPAFQNKTARIQLLLK